MKFTTKRRNRDIDINVTSMVDVVFLLLIFFMTCTTFGGSINLSVPNAASATSAKASKQVEITPTGKLFYDGKEVELERLSTLFTPSDEALIRADTTTQHGRVVEVMDKLQSAGVTKILIAANQK